MPNYRISYYLDGTFHCGTRDSEIKDIDIAFKHYERLAERYFGTGRLFHFDCVMISSHSPAIPKGSQPRKGPGKYRNK
ncbi:hypothetical protein [Flavihumibacter solisilvae]|uniref:Uncharacterized protein n=1 Tax=Flavihumibacter solisilvae TaxID=1349421 RepID=A0A0C1IV26_9BACT|nr:hypothetical protein [Flavihumibacter solisilvae]KIC94364.1 hypothetical protein OI18_12135 [Flavihumibacter solisilvae]